MLIQYTLISSKSSAYTLLPIHSSVSLIQKRNRQNCMFNIKFYKIHIRHRCSVIASNTCLYCVNATCATSTTLRVSYYMPI